MANGMKFVLDTSFSVGVRIPDDPRLDNGSLLLLEPARDGLVALPASLKNYAADQFQALSGARVDSVVVTDALTGVAGCKAEITAKGGLHGIVTTAVIPGSTRVRLAGTTPAALLAYLVANPNHAYYMGMIGRVTRNHAVAGYPTCALGGVSPPTDYIAGTTSNYGFGIGQALAGGNVAGAPSSSDSHYINRRVDSNQPYFSDIAVQGHTIVSAAALTQGRGEIFTMGERINTDNTAGWPSHILYTLWVKDLTVSGQTYAQASAEGLALFNSRFGAGGRYVGDSFTAPSAVT